VKRTNAIVIAVATLWLLGAVASFWPKPDVAYPIAWVLLAGAAILLAVMFVRRVRR